MLFGPLKSIGLLPEDFRVLAGPVAVVAGITYNFLPFTALPLYVALERIDKRLVEAAKDLYAIAGSRRSEGRAAAVVPGAVRGARPDVRAGDGRLRELERARVGPDDDGRPDHPDEVPDGGRLPEAAALSVILMLGMLVIALVYARALGTEDAALAAGAA